MYNIMYIYIHSRYGNEDLLFLLLSHGALAILPGSSPWCFFLAHGCHDQWEYIGFHGNSPNYMKIMGFYGFYGHYIVAMVIIMGIIMFHGGLYNIHIQYFVDHISQISSPWCWYIYLPNLGDFGGQMSLIRVGNHGMFSARSLSPRSMSTPGPEPRSRPCELILPGNGSYQVV